MVVTTHTEDTELTLTEETDMTLMEETDLTLTEETDMTLTEMILRMVVLLTLSSISPEALEAPSP